MQKVSWKRRVVSRRFLGAKNDAVLRICITSHFREKWGWNSQKTRFSPFLKNHSERI